MIYFCDACYGTLAHDYMRQPIACPFCRQNALRQATKEEEKVFHSDEYVPPDVEWDSEDFSDRISMVTAGESEWDYLEEPDPWEEDARFMNEYMEELFSDEYPLPDDDDLLETIEWVDTDSQVMAPKSNGRRKKKN